MHRHTYSCTEPVGSTQCYLMWCPGWPLGTGQPVGMLGEEGQFSCPQLSSVAYRYKWFLCYRFVAVMEIFVKMGKITLLLRFPTCTPSVSYFNFEFLLWHKCKCSCSPPPRNHGPLFPPSWRKSNIYTVRLCSCCVRLRGLSQDLPLLAKNLS